ncbi:hypothetical protein JVU11DRAFT_2243 [Chiua virens]|nr:hypothetical protein JVU11DRAFT_2243 [Chiua virens]
MSAAAYRLETPRPRPPPPPLRPSPRTSVHINNPNTQTLLYDLPSSPSIISPPTSPIRAKYGPASPSSPSFPSGRVRGRRGGRTGPDTPCSQSLLHTTRCISKRPREIHRILPFMVLFPFYMSFSQLSFVHAV